MSRARALIIKDLREHAATFIGLVGVSVLTYGAMLISAVTRDQQGSGFIAVANFLVFLFFVPTMVVCNRLIIREYYGGTYRFLEALPLSRLQMVATKYALGLAMVGALAATALGLALLGGGGAEDLDAPFALVLAVRAGAWVLWLYTTFFALALLGRLRHLVLCAGALVLLLAEPLWGFSLWRVSPLALVDPKTFPFERTHLPLADLGLTLAATAGAALLAAGLAALKEGAIVARLARPTTRREKAAIAAVLIAGVAGGVLSDSLRDPPPFESQGAQHLHVGRAHVAATALSLGEPGSARDKRARALMQRVAEDLDAMATYLDMETLPVIYLVHRPDLDARLYKQADLSDASGLVVALNLTHPDANDDRFMRWLLPPVLWETSHKRLNRERNNWVLMGFTALWAQRARWSQPVESELPLALRALYAGVCPVEPEALARWFTFEHEVGEDVAAGYAWLGLRVLMELRGQEQAQAFLRATLGGSFHKGALATWDDLGETTDRLLRREAGLSEQALLAAWSAKLDALRASLGPELAALPRLGARLWLRPLSNTSAALSFDLTVTQAPPGVRLQVLHRKLPPWNDTVSAEGAFRDSFEAAAVISDTAAHTYDAKDRVAASARLWLPALDGWASTRWVRLEATP